jgi:hypothetical protein
MVDVRLCPKSYVLREVDLGDKYVFLGRFSGLGCHLPGSLGQWVSNNGLDFLDSVYFGALSAIATMHTAVVLVFLVRVMLTFDKDLTNEIPISK